ncbi:hypothetical protein ONZ45_g15920 [Pleurotus djamor]|nr:hypothetical protein ONZ45_g15920 [Pleurotus djamor]
MSAVKAGATAANYCEVTELHKSDNGKISGAKLKDNLTGEEWNIRAKGIINATGPFTDTLLSLDNPAHKPIVQPSSGIHITLPNYYSPRKMGLLDPSTSDGRVIFFLPWQGNTIAGTTDSPATVTREPRAQEEEIRWVLDEVRRYLSPDIKVRRGDVLSAWSGLRPLVRNPEASSTEGLVRNHMIYVSESGLLTIAGGKWTTYREMAEETIDRAVKEFALEGRVRSGCVTESLRLVGSDGWSRNMFIGLIQRYGLETEVAKHLSDNYGDRAWTVLSLAAPTGVNWPLHGIRLHAQYPFIEAEVRYAVRHEYAQTAVDVLARRTRLSFLNVRAALSALPRVVDIMSEELHWSSQRKLQEIERSIRYFETMGLTSAEADTLVQNTKELMRKGTWFGKAEGWVWKLAGYGGDEGSLDFGSTLQSVGPVYSRALFVPGEIELLKAAFESKSSTDAASAEGSVGRDEVIEALKSVPGYENVSKKEFNYVLEEAGFEDQLSLDFDSFVEICGGLKEVSFRPIITKAKQERRRIPVEKSGGGV